MRRQKDMQRQVMESSKKAKMAAKRAGMKFPRSDVAMGGLLNTGPVGDLLGLGDPFYNQPQVADLLGLGDPFYNQRMAPQMPPPSYAQYMQMQQPNPMDVFGPATFNQMYPGANYQQYMQNYPTRPGSYDIFDISMDNSLPSYLQPQSMPTLPSGFQNPSYYGGF